MKTKIYMLIGLPGSGKSHWINENLPGVPIVSPDDIREQVFGVEFDKKVEGYVWGSTWREIALLIDAGVKEIVFDACNIAKLHREGLFFRFVPECDVIGVWIQTPVGLCKDRRPPSESFTEDIIDKMNDKWEDPEMSEGFKEIRIVKGWDEKDKQK